MSFLIGKVKKGRGAATFGPVVGVKDSFRLAQGIPLAKDWPADARFQMSDDFPDDVLLEDYLWNGSSALVVSARLQTIFEAARISALEYLPVRVMNHKGRTEKEPYFIVNCVAQQDCIDLQKTKVVHNPIDPDIFMRVRNLTLDGTRVAPELLLFRMKQYPFIDVYRDTLAAKLEAAQVTGVKFVPPEKWTIL